MVQKDQEKARKNSDEVVVTIVAKNWGVIAERRRDKGAWLSGAGRWEEGRVGEQCLWWEGGREDEQDKQRAKGGRRVSSLVL